MKIRVIFSKKKLRIQYDVNFYFGPIGNNFRILSFDTLAPYDGKFSRFEILKSGKQLELMQIFLENPLKMTKNAHQAPRG